MLVCSRFDEQYCKSTGLLVPCEYVHMSLSWRSGREEAKQFVGCLGLRESWGLKPAFRELKKSVALCSSSSSLSHNRNVQC